MKALLGIVFTFYFGLISLVNSHIIGYIPMCSAELNVLKNRNFESADYSNEASFTLLLKNTASKTTTYTLSASNISASCSNEIEIGTNKNNSALNHIDVNISIDLNNTQVKKAAKNEITLGSGQSYKFKINISVTKETPYYTWNCIEVEAKSKDCDQNSVTTILKIYVTDPTEG